jgi:cold shock protein
MTEILVSHFSHGSLLAQSGINLVQPGETVEVRVGPGHKGPHVTEVLSVDSSTVTGAPSPRPNFRSAVSNRPSSDVSVEETGTVKWFNNEKGYGFITRDSGEEDLFIHISALEQSGLTGLSEGDRVTFDVAEGRKGRKPRGYGWPRTGEDGVGSQWCSLRIPLDQCSKRAACLEREVRKCNQLRDDSTLSKSAVL